MCGGGAIYYQHDLYYHHLQEPFPVTHTLSFSFALAFAFAFAFDLDGSH